MASFFTDYAQSNTQPIEVCQELSGAYAGAYILYNEGVPFNVVEQLVSLQVSETFSARDAGFASAFLGVALPTVKQLPQNYSDEEMLARANRLIPACLENYSQYMGR